MVPYLTCAVWTDDYASSGNLELRETLSYRARQLPQYLGTCGRELSAAAVGVSWARPNCFQGPSSQQVSDAVGPPVPEVPRRDGTARKGKIVPSRYQARRRRANQASEASVSHQNWMTGFETASQKGELNSSCEKAYGHISCEIMLGTGREY